MEIYRYKYIYIYISRTRFPPSMENRENYRCWAQVREMSGHLTLTAFQGNIKEFALEMAHL